MIFPFLNINTILHDKHTTKMETTKNFTVIFFDQSGKAYKYRTIKNNIRSVDSFIQFAQTKGAVEFNFYDKDTKKLKFKLNKSYTEFLAR